MVKNFELFKGPPKVDERPITVSPESPPCPLIGPMMSHRPHYRVKLSKYLVYNISFIAVIDRSMFDRYT